MAPERKKDKKHRLKGRTLHRSRCKVMRDKRKSGHGPKDVSLETREWEALSGAERETLSKEAVMENRRHKLECPSCIQVEQETIERRKPNERMEELLAALRASPEIPTRTRSNPESVPLPRTPHPSMNDPHASQAAPSAPASPGDWAALSSADDVNPHASSLALRAATLTASPPLPQPLWPENLDSLLDSASFSATTSPKGLSDEDVTHILNWLQSSSPDPALWDGQAPPSEAAIPTPRGTAHDPGGVDPDFESHSPHGYLSSSFLPPPSPGAAAFSQSADDPVRHYDQPPRVPTFTCSDDLSAELAAPSLLGAPLDASMLRPPLVDLQLPPAPLLERKASRRTGADRPRVRAAPRQRPYTPRSSRPRAADRESRYGALLTVPSPGPPPSALTPFGPGPMGTPRSDVDLSEFPPCWVPAPSPSSAPSSGYIGTPYSGFGSASPLLPVDALVAECGEAVPGYQYGEEYGAFGEGRDVFYGGLAEGY